MSGAGSVATCRYPLGLACRGCDHDEQEHRWVADVRRDVEHTLTFVGDAPSGPEPSAGDAAGRRSSESSGQELGH